MIDPIQLIRQWLLASTAVSGFVGTNVFGEVLPEHFDPTSNAAIVISIKGGSGHGEINKLWDGEVQIKVWAGVNQFVLARSAYGAVYDTMTGPQAQMVSFVGFGTVILSYEFGTAQSLVDPDAGWATVLGTFKQQQREDDISTLPTWIDSTQTVQEYIDEQIPAEITGIDGNGDFS